MASGKYRFLYLILLASFFLHTIPSFVCAQQWHSVKWVNDGDTIVLINGLRVRYIGINAPEIDHENQKAEPYGYKARAFNKDLVLAQKIRLEFDEERYDRYGRLLAYIFLSDGSLLNQRMLQNGYAYYLHKMPNVKRSKLLIKTQQDAMKAKKGIWHNWKEEDAQYIGNLKSKRFYLSTCSSAQRIKPKNRIKFRKKWDAFKAGYAPARNCIREFWSYE